MACSIRCIEVLPSRNSSLSVYILPQIANHVIAKHWRVHVLNAAPLGIAELKLRLVHDAADDTDTVADVAGNVVDAH